jgi:Tol biopolymer transport system component
MAGGKATRITSGQSFDLHPHFSPDGKTIVFVSDRSGSDNLWLVNSDGTDLRQLTHETDRLYVSPTFTPDGKYVVASKSQSTSGSQLDLYLYYLDGGTGLRLTGDSAAGRGGIPAGGGRGNAAPNNFVGAAVTHDGRYIYVSLRNGNGGYNQTSLLWQIGVFDRLTGRTFTKTNAVGGAVRPELSPDGKWLAFATRNGAETSLKLRDLATGDEQWLVQKIQRDDQESNHTADLLPPFAFTPDSKAMVIGHHGHVWRVSVPDGRETMIPFAADVDQMIAGGIKEQFALDDSLLTVHLIRDGQVSPDNRRVVFTALDRLWVMDLPSGTPRRLIASERSCRPFRV